MSELTCGSELQNIHNKKCQQLYGPIFKLVFVPTDTGIANKATALTEATWTGIINAATASRGYVFGPFDNAEWDNEDIQFAEGNMKLRKKMRSGTRRLTALKWDAIRAEVAAYKAFDGVKGFVYVITEQGHILAASEDGTKYQPMEVEIFVDNEKPANGVSDNWVLPMYFDFKSPDLMNKVECFPAEAGTAWDAKALEGIVDCEITVVSAASGSVVVDVNGAWDGREVSGLVIGDFTLAGAASVTSVGNRYTFTPTTTFSTTTIVLKNQPTMTTKGYETQASTAVTI